MKRVFLLFTFLSFSIGIFGQVGINTSNPSPASVLDVESTDGVSTPGGFLPPRVSLANRGMIPVTAADDGMLIYLINGDERCVQIYDGVDSTWENVYCMPVNAAPVASLLNLSGNLYIGETLTAGFTYSDAESDPEGVHTYNWYRADDAIGTNETLIQFGNSNSYTLVLVDLGSYISFDVTPRATTGTLIGAAVQSAYFGDVTNVPTGGLFISEIADPNNDPTARFVEVTNGSSSALDVSSWEVRVYFNTTPTPGATFTFPALTSIAAGDSFVIAANGISFNTVYGILPDGTNGSFNSNGDDNFEIRDDTGVLIDVYGDPGNDQTGTCAEFEDGRTLRISTISNGNTTFDESEWIIRADSTIGGCTNHANDPQDAPADFSPGTHPN